MIYREEKKRPITFHFSHYKHFPWFKPYFMKNKCEILSGGEPGSLKRLIIGTYIFKCQIELCFRYSFEGKIWK